MSNNTALILIVCIIVGAWCVVRPWANAERQKHLERLKRIVAARAP